MNTIKSVLNFLGLSKSSDEESTVSKSFPSQHNASEASKRNILDEPIIKVVKKQFSRLHSDDLFSKRKYDPTKKVLVFELDNTLVHVSAHQPHKKHSIVKIDRKGKIQTFYVIQRPGLQRCLKALSKTYNICVFSNADKIYTLKVIEAAGINEFTCRIYDRNECHADESGNLLKNVWDFGFEKEKTILVDNDNSQITNHFENSLLIKPFSGETLDRELLKVSCFLEKLADCNDVRKVSERFDSYMLECRQKFEQDVEQMRQEDAWCEKPDFDRCISNPYISKQDTPERKAQRMLTSPMSFH